VRAGRDDVRHYDVTATEDIDSFDTGPFQALLSRSGAYGPGGISSTASAAAAPHPR
jgi:hypothetical protein